MKIEKSIECIGLAYRMAATNRTIDMFPGRVAVERVARLLKFDIVWQRHRQIFFRHGNRPAFCAMITERGQPQ